MAEPEDRSPVPKRGGCGIAFTYGDVEVTFNENRLVNLTQMWEAARRPGNKSPYEWGRFAGKEFVADLALALNTGKSRIWKAGRGKGGATWAHWQIALAYAKYLSNEFHRFVNEAFREWAQEKADPGLKAERAIEAYRRRGHDDRWILSRLEGILQRKLLTATLKDHGVVDEGYAICTDAINTKVLGASARSIRSERGIAPRKPLRDSLEDYELAALRLAESLAERRLKLDRAHGNGECSAVCRRAGEAVRRAVEAMA